MQESWPPPRSALVFCFLSISQDTSLTKNHWLDASERTRSVKCSNGQRNTTSSFHEQPPRVRRYITQAATRCARCQIPCRLSLSFSARSVTPHTRTHARARALLATTTWIRSQSDRKIQMQDLEPRSFRAAGQERLKLARGSFEGLFKVAVVKSSTSAEQPLSKLESSSRLRRPRQLTT